MNEQHEAQEQIRRLHLRLWEVTNDALTFAWNTPLAEEQVIRIGIQLGRLIRALERRGIVPIDETRQSLTSYRKISHYKQQRRRHEHHG